jgi:hypothetical protein
MVFHFLPLAEFYGSPARSSVAAGRLVLFIEGFTFIGDGTDSLNNNILTVAYGLVSKLEKPS